jgi:uncharacterized protein YjiS (DUF1127 family)
MTAGRFLPTSFFHFIQETYMLDWFKRTARYYNTILELAALRDEDLNQLGLKRFEIIQEANKQFMKSYGLHSQAFK